MYGLFNLPGLSKTPAQRKAKKRRKEVSQARRYAAAVPWSPKLKWDREWNIQASTYKVRSLFPDVTPTDQADVNAVGDADMKIISPEGTFVYLEKRLPQGAALATFYSNKQGTAMFDGPVLIPCLHQKGYRPHTWHETPWMSLTPMEFVTLRGGIRLAKKHTVVAGLGLGHQLIEVSLKTTVKRITLVEQSQELVDWLLPQIRPFMGNVKLTIVVGNAYHLVPKMTADVALIDIFTGYGSNDFTHCPKIPRVWCWGASHISDGGGYYG